MHVVTGRDQADPAQGSLSQKAGYALAIGARAGGWEQHGAGLTRACRGGDPYVTASNCRDPCLRAQLEKLFASEVSRILLTDHCQCLVEFGQARDNCM